MVAVFIAVVASSLKLRIPICRPSRPWKAGPCLSLYLVFANLSGYFLGGNFKSLSRDLGDKVNSYGC